MNAIAITDLSKGVLTRGVKAQCFNHLDLGHHLAYLLSLSLVPVRPCLYDVARLTKGLALRQLFLSSLL